MITDAILGFLLGAVSAVVNLLPDATTLGLGSASTGILYGYAWLNTFAPVSEILAAAGIYLGAIVIVFAVQSILAAYRLIPGKFT